MNLESQRSSLVLTAEQYLDVEHLAAINYDPHKIAIYLDVNYQKFLEEFNDEDSKIRYHYERGKLITQADIDKANLKRAKDGNLTSIQQWKKDAQVQKLENYKNKILFEKEMTEYGQLQALIEKGEIKDLPENIVTYFEQIDMIRCLINKYNSKNFIINTIRLKWPELSLFQVNNLYHETINFFYLDNDVKPQAWANFYADRLDNAALICYEMNDFETFRRLSLDAAELRGVGKQQIQIPKELMDRRPVIYTIKIQELGLPAANRDELAVFIDKLDITEKEKSLFRREAMIEDIPFEMVDYAQD